VKSAFTSSRQNRVPQPFELNEPFVKSNHFKIGRFGECRQNSQGFPDVVQHSVKLLTDVPTVRFLHVGHRLADAIVPIKHG